MSRLPSRTRSLMLVLVPGLVLGLMSVRAVTAEFDSARREAEDRAQAAAGRLARSADLMLAEFERALPSPDRPLTQRELLESLSHLSPHWLIDGDGRRMEPVRETPTTVGEDMELAVEALASAGRISAGDGGASTAGAFLVAVAETVSDRTTASVLRIAAAAYEAVDEPRTALEDLRSATDALLGTDDPRAAGLRAQALGLAADALRELPADEPLPTWTVDAYRLLASGAGALPDDEREAVRSQFEDAAGKRLPDEARYVRDLFERLRELATDEALPVPRAVTEVVDGELVIQILRRVRVAGPRGPRAALAGGRVPTATVRNRLEEEATALLADPGVVTVRLVGPQALAVLGSTPEPDTATEGSVSRTVSLLPPLADWRAEAVVRSTGGFPVMAVVLGVAALGTTLALLLGTLALRRAAEDQARLAAERQRFLDHVAHEVRTPTGALLALAEELEAGHVAPEREPLYRRHLLAEARRLASLVEETLDLTRLDAGRLAFRPEDVDLRDVVTEAVRASRARTGASGGPDVEWTTPVGPASCRVDGGATARAIRNLVDNAVLHGGGERPVVVELAVVGDHVRVTVRDFGRGIPAAELPRLFDRFHRVPSPTHETKGVGLGLALCLEVARAHGGDVTVHSELGRGSTFTLELPVQGATDA